MPAVRYEIQPGWRVFDGNGEELGTVLSVDRGVIAIQRRGPGDGVAYAPASSVRETGSGRLELSRRKEELT